MTKTYRNNRGEFTSKSEYMRRREEAAMRRFRIFCTGIIFAFVFGFVSLSQNATTPTIAAPEKARAEEKVPEWDPCTLRDVICPGEMESKVEKAIREIPHTSPVTTERIRYIYEKAEEEGVDGDVLAHIAWCETQFYNVQSIQHYDFSDPKLGIYAGEQERSYGIYQISAPHHGVTEQQALDAKYSTDWAVEQVKNGRYVWYAYNHNTDRCTHKLGEYWN